MDALRRISVPESQGLFGGDGPDGESFGLPQDARRNTHRMNTRNPVPETTGTKSEPFLLLSILYQSILYCRRL